MSRSGLMLIHSNKQTDVVSCQVYIYLQIQLDYFQQEFEDTKGVIVICKSKDRQHNGQKKKGQIDKEQSTKHYTTSIKCKKDMYVCVKYEKK